MGMELIVSFNGPTCSDSADAAVDDGISVRHHRARGLEQRVVFAGAPQKYQRARLRRKLENRPRGFRNGRGHCRVFGQGQQVIDVAPPPLFAENHAQRPVQCHTSRSFHGCRSRGWLTIRERLFGDREFAQRPLNPATRGIPTQPSPRLLQFLMLSFAAGHATDL